MKLNAIVAVAQRSSIESLKNQQHAKVGIFYKPLDRSRHLVQADFSLEYQVQHVANGLSLLYKPTHSDFCQTKNCFECIRNHAQDGYCYWCQDNSSCLPTHQSCDHFSTSNFSQCPVHKSVTNRFSLVEKLQNDHYTAALIGISVLIVVLVAFCGLFINHGLVNPSSTAGQILQALRIPARKSVPSSSMANLVSTDAEIENRNRRDSTDTTTTSL